MPEDHPTTSYIQDEAQCVTTFSIGMFAPCRFDLAMAHIN